MSTLWFDVMSRYCEDPDWSNLPGADRSGLEPWEDDEDNLVESYPASPDSQYKPKVDDLDRAKSLSAKSSKDFSWLKPPEDWKKH